MTKLTIEHNGFHGRKTVQISAQCLVPSTDWQIIYVSSRVARRINRVVCAGGDCQCGEHIADREYLADNLCDDHNQWSIKLPAINTAGVVEMRGHYPQQ